jgi:formylglycine-generating enzyme required for sulfatase activity
MVDMFGDVWRWYTDKHNHNADASGERGICVPSNHIYDTNV